MTENPEVRPKLAKAGTRIGVSAAIGVIAFGLAMVLMPWQLSVLIGWDVGAGVALAWILTVFAGKDGAATAELAKREDDSRAGSELSLVSASTASLVAVGLGFVKAGKEQGASEVALTLVAVLAVVLGWAVVHATYTLRYAHLYYLEGGGIDFNEDDPPDFRDFAYLAFTIGMTYQVSDTDLQTKTIRRAATSHALLSYLFGTAIIATTINVVANLVR
ncbi:MAG: hypothetical protein QOG64_1464 [Acidimicrobiaceae bacterium]|nr:hypothetical protein [Acidimicrobiaceae bacterium]